MNVPTGAEIQTAREAAGMSTTDLAVLAGLVDRSHLRKIERGLCDPPASTLRRIVKALESFDRPPSAC